MTIGYALTILRNTAWVGTVDALKELEEAIEVLEDALSKIGCQ